MVVKQLRISQQATVDEPLNKLTVPKLFLSSEGAKWQDLLVEAYHEPDELEGWLSSVSPDTVLVLLTHGNMQMQVNGARRPFHIHQNDFFLRPGNSTTNELGWKNLSVAPMQTLHIRLNSALLHRTAAEITGNHPTNLALIRRTGFQDALLKQIGLELRRELEQPTITGDLYAQTAAQMLAVHLLRHYAAQKITLKEPKQGLTRPQLHQITEFIQVYLTENLSLEALGQQIGFSPYYFARLFRQSTGESPHQYVLRLRLERVQSLLKNTDLSLTQIALESGFANQSHLTQSFKRQFGVTPKTYRQAY
jgi:AraC family transcriptional regulator